MRRGLLLVLLLAIVGVAALAAWRLDPLCKQVHLVPVHRGPAVRAIYATGTVEGVFWARVAPMQSGRIVEILARDGQKVAKGQPLIRFDDRESRMRLSELEARERYWRDELGRVDQLQQRGVSSREALERTRSEHNALLASIEGQKQRLSEMTLVSPLDGIVLRQDGEIGEVVDARTTVMWVGTPRPLRVTAEVDEEDVPLVRLGQSVLIKADAFPGTMLRATVAEITPRGDPIQKSFRVRLALPDDTPLHIGMTVETNILVREVASALLLPATTLVEGTVVMVVEGDQVRGKPVTVGIRGRHQVEILEGLEEGAKVVANPVGLVDGDRVRVAPR
jgi:RND family efflux transporter MFP subunit